MVLFNNAFTLQQYALTAYIHLPLFNIALSPYHAFDTHTFLFIYMLCVACLITRRVYVWADWVVGVYQWRMQAHVLLRARMPEGIGRHVHWPPSSLSDLIHRFIQPL